MSTRGWIVLDRVAQRLVRRAARRWPQDVAEIMAEQWSAELAALRGSTQVSAGRRAVRGLAFAVSLAITPAVEAPDAEPVARLECWARWVAGAVAVALLAGGLFNGVHVVADRAGAGWAALALVVAATLMGAAAFRFDKSVALRTMTIGAALFAFLLAGNRVAVMPFMGWADVAPAVLVWTTLSVAFARRVQRLAVTHRWRAAGLAVLGALVTLEVATIAGAAHAAATLATGWRWAAAWFPLALAPGRTIDFGPVIQDGWATTGTTGSVPTSAILLGNISAMAGPMLLCSVFVTVLAVRGRQRVETAPPRTVRVDTRIVLGVGATLAALVGCEVIRRLPVGDLETTLPRLIENSTVFGFGFVGQTAGRVAIALMAGLLAAQLGVLRRRAI